MKLLYSDKWTRSHDGVQMKVNVHKTDQGVVNTMYDNGQQVWQVESKRPYTLGQPCDGTIDVCVHALFIHYCRAKGLDPHQLYHTAYPETEKDYYNPQTQKRILCRAEKEGVEIPEEWGGQEIDGLIDSLTEINNHSLAALIE